MRLIGVCCHFNPGCFRSRVRNFDAFRRRIKRARVPLLTVELAFDDTMHELVADDLIRVRSDSVMWQKERLLNLASDQIAGDCDAILWLDADIEFVSQDWPDRIRRTLESRGIVQCFDSVDRRFGESDCCRPGFAHRLLQRERALEACGVAWAIRQDLFFAGLRWYEHAIVGGSDGILARACQASVWPSMNPLDSLPVAWKENPALLTHCGRWIDRTIPLLDGQIGRVRQKVVTHSHGTFERRQYDLRHEILRDFNPGQDVRSNQDGVFEWSTAKPSLHCAVKSYFLERREDD